MRTVLALLVLAACGGDSVDPVPLEQLSARSADAVCAWATRCIHVPDDATCRRLIDPKDYDTRRTEDAVAAGRLVYDPDAAGECLARTADASCLATPFADPACDAMLAGVVTQGGACTSAFECADFADCEAVTCSGQCCVGACGAPGFDPGEPPPRTAIGGACDTHLDCVDEAYCEIDGSCTEMPDAPGERCLFGCARGDLYCDIDVFECRAYAARGEACDPERASAPPCDPTWSYCAGECRDRPGEGEACDASDRRCIASTWCDGDPGVCRGRGAAGAVCAAADQCEVTCDGAVCLEYETCTVD